MSTAVNLAVKGVSVGQRVSDSWGLERVRQSKKNLSDLHIKFVSPKSALNRFFIKRLSYCDR